MHRLDTSYTKYFNLNNKRTGRLFEYTFKAKLIESEEMLLHVSRYIHLNPLIASLVNSLNYWPWSSYLDFIGTRDNLFLEQEEILGKFNDPKSYQRFVDDQVAYARLLKEARDAMDENALFI